MSVSATKAAFNASAATDVLPDDEQRPAGNAAPATEGATGRRHQGDVGRLQGRIGPRRSHGDAQAGAGHGRGVIDSVAHHRHVPVPGHELLDGGHLCPRQQFGPDFIDAGGAGHRLGGSLVVAGQHDHVRMPAPRRSAMAWRALPRTASAMAIRPHTWWFSPTTATLDPSTPTAQGAARLARLLPRSAGTGASRSTRGGRRAPPWPPCLDAW